MVQKVRALCARDGERPGDDSALAHDLKPARRGRGEGKLRFAQRSDPREWCCCTCCRQIGRATRIFTLDTGRLPNETHELMHDCEKRYGVQIDVYAPDPSDIREMVKAHGINLFYDSVELRELCCEVRKVRPMLRALEGLSAWITGLRRIQTVTRRAVRKIEIDSIHDGILKLNPLCEWSEQEVWDYINAHQLPYNALHDHGYRSIGCEPCTRAINPGEDLRAGRWWWEARRQEGMRNTCFGGWRSAWQRLRRTVLKIA